MSETPFYRTRMGHRFYESTMPELVEQLSKLAKAVDRLAVDRRDPAVKELIVYAADLAGAAEDVLDSPITGSSQTVEAFDLLRSYAAAVRRILAKIG